MCDSLSHCDSYNRPAYWSLCRCSVCTPCLLWHAVLRSGITLGGMPLTMWRKAPGSTIRFVLSVPHVLQRICWIATSCNECVGLPGSLSPPPPPHLRCCLSDPRLSGLVSVTCLALADSVECQCAQHVSCSKSCPVPNHVGNHVC